MLQSLPVQAHTLVDPTANISCHAAARQLRGAVEEGGSNLLKALYTVGLVALGNLSSCVCQYQMRVPVGTARHQH